MKKNKTPKRRLDLQGGQNVKSEKEQGTGFSSIPSYQTVAKKSGIFSPKGSRTATKARASTTMHTTTFAVVILVVVIGYLFFFCSSFIFPRADELNLSTIGEKYSFSDSTDRTATVTRWDYSESQELTEVEIELENNTFDGNNQYLISCYSVQGEEVVLMEHETMLQHENLVILEFPVYRNFDELLVRIEVDVGQSAPTDDDTVSSVEQQQNQFSGVLLFTNRNDVNRVDEIEPKSENTYLMNRLKITIDQYKDERSEIEAQIEEANKTIQNIKKTNKQLEDDKLYQTEKENEDTDKRIEENELEIEDVQNDLEELEKSKADYDRLIANSEAKYAELARQ